MKIICLLVNISSYNWLLHLEPYNSSAGKGKQMLIGGSKSKTAFVDGYFEKKFDRIMEVREYKLSVAVFGVSRSGPHSDPHY